MYLSFAVDAIIEAQAKVDQLKTKLELAEIELQQATALEEDIERRAESLVDEVRDFIESRVDEVTEELLYEYNVPNPYNETGIEISEAIADLVRDSI